MKLKKLLFLIPLAFGGISLSSCNEEAPTPEPKVVAKKTHNENTLQVDGKDKREPHDFKDGKCTMCDETTIFKQDPIGGTDLLKENSKKGTIETIKYEARSYYIEDMHPEMGEIKVEKTAYVYLPYGYNKEDKNTKYNVLYLVHGHGLNEGYWLAQGSYTRTDGCYTMGYGTDNLLDNMHEKGLCEKTIVVTPTFYSPVEGIEVGEEKGFDITAAFGKELQNDLMPYIARNYNTYAKSDSKEDLIKNRDHQAYAGLSMGSIVSFESIWSYCLPYFSYIGSYSAMDNDAKNQELINNKNTVYKDYDIKYWYVTFGTSEYKEQSIDTYLKFVNNVKGLKMGSDIKNGENTMFMLCNKTAHNYATWITALYNSMLVFFKA
jgi:endo-1,4-beta-xylanase